VVVDTSLLFRLRLATAAFPLPPTPSARYLIYSTSTLARRVSQRATLFGTTPTHTLGKTGRLGKWGWGLGHTPDQREDAETAPFRPFGGVLRLRSNFRAASAAGAFCGKACQAAGRQASFLVAASEREAGQQ
jgi:hypothetical protein